MTASQSAMTEAPTIARVTDPADGAAAAGLVRAFWAFLHARYPERSETLDSYWRLKNIDGDLAAMAAGRIPEDRRVLLARLGEAPAGTVMLTPVDARLCEMNRLFVAPSARGHGVGRALVAALLDEARDAGFSKMRLEAYDRHDEALPLYAAMGFGPDPDPTDFARTAEGVVSLRRRL